MKKLIFSFVTILLFIGLPIQGGYAQNVGTASAPTATSSATTTPSTQQQQTTVPIDLQQRMIMLKKMMESQSVPQTPPSLPSPVSAQNQQNPPPATNLPGSIAPQPQVLVPANAGPVNPQQVGVPFQPTPAPTATPATAVTQQMQAQPVSGGLYDEAFSGVVTQMLPMTPTQIAKLRMLFNETQRAAVIPPGIPPKPTTSSVMVNLSPEATPPVIKLGAGYITSLVFIDSTGQPWPITAYSIGDPTAFNIQWDKVGNTLLIQAASYYKRSNLAVILKGLNTPVMITLLSGQDAVEYRVDLRIPGLGPNAVVMQNGLPDSANPILLDVLNGLPPPGSKTLKIEGGDCQGWLIGNKMYLRTSLDVISPAWKAVMSSIDGTHAYELEKAPVVLALQRGKDKTLILSIEGFE